MSNFQASLIEAIERYLTAKPNVFENPHPKLTGLAETSEIFVEQAPIRLVEFKPKNTHLTRLVRKFDPAKRDARNRELGRLGEEVAIKIEEQRLVASNRSDLAKKIRWVSQKDGDGAGYDIHSFDINGKDRLIEVKTTNGHKLTPFYISENECSFSEEEPDRFKLLRLYEFSSVPRAFELEPPLSNFVVLNPTNYRAQFN